MNKLISTDVCFANTKQMLNSYEAFGMLSDSDLFRWTKWVINRLGISQMVEKELVLDVENYKVALPEDFALLWVIHKCNACNDQDGVSTYRWYQPEQRLILKDWVNKNCYSNCDVCRNDEVYEVTRTVELETKEINTQRFCDRTLMSLNKRVAKEQCHQKCPNLYSKSTNNFNIDNNFIYTNFCEGHIHLQYYAHALDEDGYPMILDNEYVKQAIEDYLIFKSFQSIFYNNAADVQQRLQYAETKYQQSLKEALNADKLISWKRLIKFGQDLPKSLETFNLKSVADAHLINDGTTSIHSKYDRYQSRHF
jgi:hypothetical protein